MDRNLIMFCMGIMFIIVDLKVISPLADNPSLLIIAGNIAALTTKFVAWFAGPALLGLGFRGLLRDNKCKCKGGDA